MVNEQDKAYVLFTVRRLYVEIRYKLNTIFKNLKKRKKSLT